MTSPSDVGTSVESCLAQTWEFITGVPMDFQASHSAIQQTGPAVSFIQTLCPNEADWSAGIILTLSGAALIDANQSGSEICNVFSGCVTRLFSQREEFQIGLPIRIPRENLVRLMADIRVINRYISRRNDVLLIAFEADKKLIKNPGNPSY